MEDHIDNIDDMKYLLYLTDCDGDRISVANPWDEDHSLMMRIENDHVTTGIIIDLPIALALIGVLLPMIQSAKFASHIERWMNPELDEDEPK